MRKLLFEGNDTLPNQLNKEVQNPTLRWIFQLMDGIAVGITRMGNPVQTMIANVTPLTEKIIRLFGPQEGEIYGIQSAASIRSRKLMGIFRGYLKCRRKVKLVYEQPGAVQYPFNPKY